MLEVRLLGQFDVHRDGAPVEIPSRPAQSLLAFLILNAGIPYRREKLAGLLWPGSSERNARNNLRQALWRLRRALEGEASGAEGFLVSDNFTLTFNPDSDYWLDAVALERDLPGDHTTNDLKQSVLLYRGDLLPGFYEDWVVSERERLRILFGEKIDRLIQHLLAERNWHEVLEWAEHWIAQDRIAESAYRALMLAHSSRGEIGSVAEAYERCLDSLEGLEPSMETQALYEALVSGTDPGEFLPAATGEGQEGIPAPLSLAPDPMETPAPRQPVFVARKRELEILVRHLDQSLKGAARVVFVTGDTGRGKTALIRRFAEEAGKQRQDLHLAVGNCNAQTGVGDPYLPFRQILR